MIVIQDGSFTFEHDMGRPTYFEDEDFERWGKYFDFIEQSDIPIVVNGLYHRMREYCDQRKKYGGNGYKFCFWFRSEKSREKFEDGIDKIRGYRIIELTGERLVRYKQYIYDLYGGDEMHNFYLSRKMWVRGEPLT